MCMRAQIVAMKPSLFQQTCVSHTYALILRRQGAITLYELAGLILPHASEVQLELSRLLLFDAAKDVELAGESGRTGNAAGKSKSGKGALCGNEGVVRGLEVLKQVIKRNRNDGRFLCAMHHGRDVEQLRSFVRVYSCSDLRIKIGRKQRVSCIWPDLVRSGARFFCGLIPGVLPSMPSCCLRKGGYMIRCSHETSGK